MPVPLFNSLGGKAADLVPPCQGGPPPHKRARYIGFCGVEKTWNGQVDRAGEGRVDLFRLLRRSRVVEGYIALWGLMFHLEFNYEY